MINPNLLTASYKRWLGQRFAGGWNYVPVLRGGGTIVRTRRVFERASEAQAYAERILVTWKRVYPMWVAMQANTKEPTP